MRSRFTAFSLGNPLWLLRSWHPATRPATLELDSRQRWTGLEVIESQAGDGFLDEAWVRFAAHYRRRGTSGTLRETSMFRRVAGTWHYVGPV